MLRDPSLLAELRGHVGQTARLPGVNGWRRFAAACLALYFATRPEPLWTVVGWNLFFLALNGFQVACLLRDARRNLRDTGATHAAL